MRIKANKIRGLSGISPFSRAHFVAGGITPGSSIWVRADYGLLKDDGSGGFIPVTTAGDLISKWLDASGNANNLTQTTSGARPTYQPNTQNGLPTVLSNGSSDFFNIATPFYPGSNWTAFQAIQKISGRFPCLSNSTTGDPTSFLSYSDGNIYTSNRLGYIHASDPATVFDIWVTRNTGDVLEIIKNGVSLSVSGLVSNPFSTSWDVMLAAFTSGDNRFANGNTGELFVYPSSLPNATVNLNGRYLQRWGPSWTDLP